MTIERSRIFTPRSCGRPSNRRTVERSGRRETPSSRCSGPRSTAVLAAVRAQRALAGTEWPHGGSLRVRMGLHTGEGSLGGDDYIGVDVNRAARIASAGHGGQVLISDTTRALVEAELPEGVSVRNLGRHGLKDFEEQQPLFDLVIQGLPAEFPAIRTLESRRDQPSATANVLRRARARAHRDRRPAHADQAPHPDRTRRHGQDAPRAPGRRRTARSIRGRGVRRRPERNDGSPSRPLGHRGVARRARGSQHGPARHAGPTPAGSDASPRPGQRRTGRRGGARRGQADGCGPAADGPRHEPHAAAPRRRARLPGRTAPAPRPGDTVPRSTDDL